MAQWKKFIPVTKVDTVNRLVYGTAVIETVDKMGEIFDYSSSKPHFEEWSNGLAEATRAVNPAAVNYGNIRAMHGKVAAGRCVEPLDFDDDGKLINICAKIVDDAEWNKVEEGVYTGLSIGGDYVKRWNDNGTMRYTAKPSEISIVDNPAIPGAHFSVIKMDGAVETRPFAKYAAPGEHTVNITNEMVVAKAQELAKAAGATSYSGFIGAARTELEKADAPFDRVPMDPPGVMKPSGKATITDHSGGVPNTEDKTPGGAMGAEGQDDQAVPKPSAPGNEGDASLREGAGGATHPTLGKDATNLDPRNEVKQGWQSKDGTFHLTKAAAIAHNTKLDDPSAKLDAALDELKGALGKKAPPDMNDNAEINADQKAKAKAKAGKADEAEATKTHEAENDTSTEKAADAPGDGSKPYGDVKYADPGYKADKKKRYPVDTEKHIKAAWSYIHKPKNQEGYTAQQVSSIKSKIVAAWKDVIGGEPPAATEKAFGAGQLQKGLYTVSRLACLIDELTWLQADLVREAIYEGDNSPLPAQMKGDIASLVGTLKNLVAEETSELFDGSETEQFAEMLEMAADGMPQTRIQKFVDYLGAQSLAKSDGIPHVMSLLKSKMSKEHVAHLQDMHDKCVSMGAKCDAGDMGKAAGNTLQHGDLAKGMEVLSAENSELRKSLEKATAAIVEMAATVKRIEEQPVVVPASRLNVVSKGADVNGGLGGVGDDANSVLKSMSPEVLAAAAIRMTHAAGGHRVFRNGGNT